MNIKNVAKGFAYLCACIYKLAFLCFFIYFGFKFLEIYKATHNNIPLGGGLTVYNVEEDCFYHYEWTENKRNQKATKNGKD